MASPDPHAEHDASRSDRAQDLGGNSPPVRRQGSTYMTEKEAEKFCRTFADGLDSGIGYSRILDILERQKFDSGVIQRLRTSLLEKGDMLGEALERLGILDSSARTLVYVSEQQGALPTTFSQLADIYRQRYKRKKKIAMSFVEPLVMMALGILLINLLSRDLVAVVFSDSLASHAKDWIYTSGLEIAIFALIVGSLIGWWLNLPVEQGIRKHVGRLWMQIPVVSAASRKLSVAMFCRYLKESISNGMTIFNGLELAADASQNPDIMRGIDRARRRIQEGGSLVEALRSINGLPDKVIEQVDIGEESGRLEERLNSLASDYREESDEAFERLSGVITWIVRYSIIILVIGAVFVSVVNLKPG